MRYASEDLRNEHEGIIFGLKILESMARMLEGKKKPETEDVLGMIDFLRLFADKCHHGKEEGLMFPAMEKAGIPKQGGPIGQMLLEHDEGRGYISQMSESIQNGRINGEKFIPAATAYAHLLRKHIEKENMVLFPLGDKRVPADVQSQLLNSFEEFEEEVMGKGTHEKLHKLLNDLEHKYL